MRWNQNNLVIIPHEDINAKIIGLKERGITIDKFALAYARVSTKHEEQEGSKENQVEECQEYADKQGLSLVYTFECAESAKAQGRKVFNSLIETALHYNIKNLILKDTSRLTRNLGDKDKINQLIEKDKINIHFYLPPGEILTSNSDFTISDIFSVFDSRFSRELSKKMKHAARKKKEKGIPIQLPAGYKFKKNANGESETSIIEIDKKYENIIREMFDLYLNKNYTLERIAEYFNSMNYITRQKKPFYASTVHRMITSKAYTGKYFWDKTEWKKLNVPCPAYITEEQYNEIQRIIKVNSRGTKKRRQKSYLLTSFVLCSDCNCFASGNRPEDEIYYTHKCKQPVKYAKPYWTEKSILNAINSEVEKFFYDEKHTAMLKNRLKKIVNSKSTITQKITNEINQQISRLRRQKDVLLNDRLDETISKEDYKYKNAEIENSLKACQGRLSGLSVDLSKHYNEAENTIEAIRDFTTLYKQAVNSEKIRLLREMANWIHFNGEQAVIEWKKPFDILLSTEENVINHPSALIKTEDEILLSRVADGT